MLKTYHGTGSERFRVFKYGRAGIFTTPDMDVAKTYGNTLYSLYANTGGKQLVVDAEGAVHNEIPVETVGLDLSEYPYFRNRKSISTDELCNLAFRSFGYDSVVIRNVSDDSFIGAGNGALTTDIVFKAPSQVKSADSIVYSEDGNVVPLSDRFRSDRTGAEAWKNDDVNYSIGTGSNVDTYNSKQYYKYGWIIENGIVPRESFAQFFNGKSNQKLKQYYVETGDGRYLIPAKSNPKAGNDILFVTDGNYEEPEISAVYTFKDGEYPASKCLEAFLDETRDDGLDSAVNLCEAVFGEESISRHNKDDEANYQRYSLSREGSSAGNALQDSAAEQGRERDAETSQRVPRGLGNIADDGSTDNGASFMSKTLGDGSYSLAAPPKGLTRDQRTQMYQWRDETLADIRKES